MTRTSRWSLPIVSATTEDSLEWLLAGFRDPLGMEGSFRAEYDGDKVVFRKVYSDGESAITVGAAEPIEDTVCHLIADGRVPNVIPDLQALPEAAGLAAVVRTGARAFVGAP